MRRLLIWQNVFRKRSREVNSTSSFHVPLRSCSLPVERRRVRKASESTRQEKRELMPIDENEFYLAGEGRVIAKMNAIRIQMMLF